MQYIFVRELPLFSQQTTYNYIMSYKLQFVFNINETSI